jgi:hypothetical protein
MIVSMGSMVQTDGPRRNSVRRVSNLAALLELPDPHVDVSYLLSVRHVAACPEPGTGDGVTGVAARDLSRRAPL